MTLEDNTLYLGEISLFLSSLLELSLNTRVHRRNLKRFTDSWVSKAGFFLEKKNLNVQRFTSRKLFLTLEDNCSLQIRAKIIFPSLLFLFTLELEKSVAVRIVVWGKQSAFPKSISMFNLSVHASTVSSSKFKYSRVIPFSISAKICFVLMFHHSVCLFDCFVLVFGPSMSKSIRSKFQFSQVILLVFRRSKICFLLKVSSLERFLLLLFT